MRPSEPTFCRPSYDWRTVGFSLEGYGSDGVFDRVGVHLDAAIGQDDLQAIPVAVDVADQLAQAGFGGDAAAFLGRTLP